MESGFDRDALWEHLKENDNYLLCSHESPDADALGSEFALFELLNRLGKQVRILNEDPAPEKFSSYDQHQRFESLRSGAALPGNLQLCHLIVLDVGDFDHLGTGINALVLPEVSSVTIVDHHTQRHTEAARFFVDEGASSTCQMVYELFRHGGQRPSLESCQALFAGMVFDTGSFIYPKTSSETFRIAAELVDMGVKPKEIHSHLYETLPVSTLKLLALVQSTLQFHYDDRIVVQHMSRSMLMETQGNYEDADSFVNYPLKSPQVQISVFFKETPSGALRCSLRSKGPLEKSLDLVLNKLHEILQNTPV